MTLGTPPIYDIGMAKVDILGVQHDYQLTPGQGQSDITLVFVHGWLLSQQFWQPVIQTLKSNFNCLSYDLRGFGASNGKSCPKSLNPIEVNNFALSNGTIERCQFSDFSPAAFAWDLLLLLSELNVERPWLVGHSLGGTIAVWATAIAQSNPSLLVQTGIEGLICINSGGGIYVQEDFEQFRSAGQQIFKFRQPWLANVPGLPWIFRRSNVARAVSHVWGRQLLTDFLRVNREAGERSLLDSTTPEEVLLLPQLMRQIQQPAYFLAGDRDRVMAPKFVRHLASFHHLFDSDEPNVFELENCGHLSMIEHPTEVSRLIVRLVSRHKAS